MASRVMMPRAPTSKNHSLSNSIPHLRDHQVTGSLDQPGNDSRSQCSRPGTE